MSTAVTHLAAAVISTSSVRTCYLLVCLPLAGLALHFLFSRSVCSIHTFSRIQSITHYPFVMQMLPVWDSVHDLRLKYSFWIVLTWIFVLYTVSCISQETVLTECIGSLSVVYFQAFAFISHSLQTVIRLEACLVCCHFSQKHLLHAGSPFTTIASWAPQKRHVLSHQLCFPPRELFLMMKSMSVLPL